MEDLKLYTDDVEYNAAGGEYIPSDTDKNKIIERRICITSNNDIFIEFEKYGSNISITYNDNNCDDTYIELPLIYYKGYKAQEGDKYLKVEKGDNGVVRVYLEKASGLIEVSYAFTTYRHIGTLVSVISIIIFILLFTKRNRINHQYP